MTAGFSMGFYFEAPKALRAMLGTAPPCDRGWVWCAPMTAVNRSAPKGTRRTRYPDVQVLLAAGISCSVRVTGRCLAFPGASTRERWQWFYANGFTMILPDPTDNPPNLNEDLAHAPEWVIAHRDAPDDPLSPIWISYDLTKPGSPQEPPGADLQDIRGDYWLPVRAAAMRPHRNAADAKATGKQRAAGLQARFGCCAHPTIRGAAFAGLHPPRCRSRLVRVPQH